MTADGIPIVWIPDEFLQHPDALGSHDGSTHPRLGRGGGGRRPLPRYSMHSPTYCPATCLTHAEQLFTFADTYQGMIS